MTSKLTEICKTDMSILNIVDTFYRFMNGTLRQNESHKIVANDNSLKWVNCSTKKLISYSYEQWEIIGCVFKVGHCEEFNNTFDIYKNGKFIMGYNKYNGNLYSNPIYEITT